MQAEYPQLHLYSHRLAGVYAAAVTPLRPDLSLALDDLPLFLDFLANRGCHGALLFGTTGEGPSFASSERISLLRQALSWKKMRPDFHLLLGTGMPGLEDTCRLTRAAFDLGVDGVVILPPYYYKKVSDDGLFAWFREVIQRAVPPDGVLLAYHIPSITGIGFSLDLLARLKDAFPKQFIGLKDSSSDAEYARQLAERFGSDLVVFNGNDGLFSHALQHAAAGCITALANLFSPELRQIWDAHQSGNLDQVASIQARLSQYRALMDRFPPAPPLLKALLARRAQLPRWSVLPPLLPISPELETQASAEMDAVG